MNFRLIRTALSCSFVLPLTLSVLVAGAPPVPLPPGYPAWWYERDVIPTNGQGAYLAADDFALANVGQLKYIASKAAAEFNTRLSGGAGDPINALIAKWASPATGPRDDFMALNQGQLKRVAELFYNRLYEMNYRGAPLSQGTIYPWTGVYSDDDAFAAVNLGQLKLAFCFNLETGFRPFLPARLIDSDADGLLDATEIGHFGNLVQVASGDPDDDGLTNLQELNLGLNPAQAEVFGTNSVYLPRITPIGGEANPDGRLRFVGEAAIRLENRFPVGTLRYTLDGSAPTSASPLCKSGDLVKIPPTGLVDLHVGLFLGGKQAPAVIVTGLYLLTNPFGVTADIEPNLNLSGLVRLPAPRIVYKGQKPYAGIITAPGVAPGAIEDWSIGNLVYLELDRSQSTVGTATATWSIAGSWGTPVVAFQGGNTGNYVQVKAVGAGADFVSVTVGGQTATINVYVTSSSSVSSTSPASKTVGSTQLFTLAANQSLSSSNHRVAMVYGDTVYFVGSGRVTIFRKRFVGSVFPQTYYCDAYNYNVTGAAKSVLQADWWSYSPAPVELTGVQQLGSGWLLAVDGSWPKMKVIEPSTEIFTPGTFTPANADTDGDGMLDAFERVFYSNLKWNDPLKKDTDADTLPDTYEIYRSYLDPAVKMLATYDLDNDGQNHAQEYQAETNPLARDTLSLIDTYSLDSDGDGIPDVFETSAWTNPALARQESLSADFRAAIFAGWLDVDNDWLPNSYEALSGRNSTGDSSVADSDLDGLSNRTEWALGTRPDKIDTDDDGMPDGWEVQYNLDPRVTDGDLDSDGDGLSDRLEYEFDSNPRRIDSEQTADKNPYTDTMQSGDGLLDFEEILFGLDARAFDSTLPNLSGSGLSTLAQLKDLGTNSDSDSLSDLAEAALGTSPTNSDSDGDGLPDDYEQYNNLVDSDGDRDDDRLTDLQEYQNQNGTLPNLFDTDGDGLSDRYEVASLTIPEALRSDPLTLRGGILAWWRFDEQINYKKANGNGSTQPASIIPDTAFARHAGRLRRNALLVVDTTMPYVASRFYTRIDQPKALKLDGVDAYVTVPNYQLPELNTDFTVTLWFKPDANSLNQTRQLIDRRGAWTLEVVPVKNGAGVVIGNQLAFTAYVGGVALAPFTSTAGLTAGVWNLITVTLDRQTGGTPAQLSLRIDVKAVPNDLTYSVTHSDLALNQAFAATPWPLVIGSQRTLPSSRTPVGRIGDLRLYDRVLTNAEISALFNPSLANTDGGKDPDGDGLKNIDEQRYGTDPELQDTDGDTLSDYAEWNNPNVNLRSDPMKKDSDGDMLEDGRELATSYLVNGVSQPKTQTYPLNTDTDGDKLSDYRELYTDSPTKLEDCAYTPRIQPGSSSLIKSAAPNQRKDYAQASAPIMFDGWDTDNDGMPDGWEVYYGFDLAGASDRLGDPDGDGRVNHLEYAQGKDPLKADPDTVVGNDDTGDPVPSGAHLAFPRYKIRVEPKLETTIEGPLVELAYSSGDQVFLSEEAFTQDRKLITAVDSILVRAVSPALAGGTVADLVLTRVQKAYADPYQHVGEVAAAAYSYGAGYDISSFAAQLLPDAAGKIKFRVIVKVAVSTGGSGGGIAGGDGVNDTLTAVSCGGGFNCPPVIDPPLPDPDCLDCPPPYEPPLTDGGGNSDSGFTPNYNVIQQPPEKPDSTNNGGSGGVTQQTFATTRILAYVYNQFDLAITHAARPDLYLAPVTEDRIGATLSYARPMSGGGLQLPTPRAKLRIGKGPAATASRTLTWDDTKLVVFDSSGVIKSTPLVFANNNITELFVAARPNVTGATLIQSSGVDGLGAPFAGLSGDTVQVLASDLDIDSDNNNDTSLPGHTQAEEDLESTTSADPAAMTATGKIIFANTGDVDGNGVPNYADGIDRTECTGTDEANVSQSPSFVPLVLALDPAITDWKKMKVRFVYSAANPNCVNRDATTGVYSATPAGNNGQIRIWSKNGTDLRKVAVLSLSANGGDYVAENTSYELATLGFSATTKVVTLYIEGIKPGADRACSIVVRASAADEYGDFGPFSEIAKIEATVRAQ